MRISFLQVIFLSLLILIFFYGKPSYGKRINNFVNNIKKYNSFRK